MNKAAGATRYPLAWPDGWHRTPAHQRKRATFGRKETRPGNSWKSHARLTVNDATCRVLAELERLGVVRDDDIIISTMIRVRLDGRPRSGEPEPNDPGVAVYWERSNEPPRCMAIDLYDRVADNLAAVAEASTGMTLGKGATEASAVRAAIEKAERFTADQMKAAVEQGIRTRRQIQVKPPAKATAREAAERFFTR